MLLFINEILKLIRICFYHNHCIIQFHYCLNNFSTTKYELFNENVEV